MDRFDNIVFKNKNRAYGAYHLRQRYYKNLSIGLIISVISFIAVALFSFIESMSNANRIADDYFHQMVADYEQYAMLKDVDTLMIMSPPKKLVSKKDDQSFKVVDSLKHQADTLRKMKLPDQKRDDVNDSLASSDSSRAGSLNGSGGNTMWVKVGTLPTPPCGFTGLKRFQSMYTTYPEDAKKNKIQGDVEVELYVRKEGNVEKVSISKSVNPQLDKEALRVTNMFIKAYPKWSPGRRNGSPVDFLTYLKFKFRLY